MWTIKIQLYIRSAFICEQILKMAIEKKGNKRFPSFPPFKWLQQRDDFYKI